MIPIKWFIYYYLKKPHETMKIIIVLQNKQSVFKKACRLNSSLIIMIIISGQRKFNSILNKSQGSLYTMHVEFLSF